MDFSVGDHVRLVDGRTGVIGRINLEGRFDLNLDQDPDDPVVSATQGHAALRPAEAQPEGPMIVVHDVPAAHLAQLNPK